MNRNRAWRRAMADRYKAKSRRDFRDRTGDEARSLSDTRHALDCGRPGCGLCSGERYGKRERAIENRELRLAA